MGSRPRMFRTTTSNLILALVIGLVLVACGASQGESGAPEESVAAASQPAASADSGQPSEAPVSTAPEPASQPPVGEAGSFTVDGTEFAVTRLNPCVPFNEAPDDLDLQALAPGAQLNLYLMGGTTEVSVQGSAIQSQFGSIAFGEGPVVNESSVSGGRWTGSATVGDSMGSGETVDLTWDVQIPSEINDCSL